MLTDAELELLHDVLDLARNGATDQLAAAIEAGVPANLTDASGNSLLILAAYHDHPSAVRTLLDRGADVHRVNDNGQTALAAAVFRRSAVSVRALLAAGADPDEGPRSARQITDFFQLDDMAAELERPHDTRREC